MKNQSIVEQLEAEIAEREQQLAALRAAHAALTGGTVAKAATPKERAPAGHLEQAIENLLKKSGPQENGGIRKKLKDGGYTYAITPNHIGKTLRRMAKAKRVKVEHRGKQWFYSAT